MAGSDTNRASKQWSGRVGGSGGNPASGEGDSPVENEDWKEPADSKQWRQAWKAARPHNRQDIMLDVFKDSGECYSFEYAYLNPIHWNGGDEMMLDFGSHRVLVKGRHLKPLRRALSCHIVDFIQEGNDSEDEFKDESECHIYEIGIFDKEEKNIKEVGKEVA